MIIHAYSYTKLTVYAVFITMSDMHAILNYYIILNYPQKGAIFCSEC